MAYLGETEDILMDPQRLRSERSDTQGRQDDGSENFRMVLPFRKEEREKECQNIFTYSWDKSM
jgi:hypothetical protein